MSSAGVVVAPLAVPVIVAAGAVAVVGGAAVLMVRAAGAATEVLAAGAERLGEAMAQAAQEQLDLQRSARLWEMAAAEVVSLNARVAVLAATARSAGVAVELPAPYRADCCQLDEVYRWCVAAEASLRAARERVDEAAVAQERAYFAATGNEPSSAEVLARHQQRLRQRAQARPAMTPAPAVGTVERVEREVAQWLGRLDADATVAERRSVLERAGTVSRQTDPGTAWTYLDQLKADIKVVNAGAAQRRLAAQWLVALEDQAVAAEPPPVPDLTRRLRAVVDGGADLDQRLRADADAGLRWAEDVVDRAYLRTSVQECLHELGYQLDTEMDITHGGAARMVRPNWGSGHFAEVRDEAGRMTVRVVRRYGAIAAEAAARDGDCCDDLIDDLDQIRARLEARGLPVDEITTDRVVDRETPPAKVDATNTITTPKQRYHKS